MIIVFDTETTGLIPKEASFDNPEQFPHIVQIAWQTYTNEGKLLKEYEYIIKPTGFVIPQHTVDIHGITQEYAESYGTPIKPVLEEIENDIKNADIIVGHNLSFDARMLLIESIRNKVWSTIYKNKNKHLCTMKASMAFVGETFKDGKLKRPGLQQLYKTCFGKEFEGAHNALVDIKATADCYFYLKSKKLV